MNPGNTNLHLHSEGTPITIWLEELVDTELRLAKLEVLLVLEELEDFGLEEALETTELKLEVELVNEIIDEADELSLIKLLKELIAGTAEDMLTSVTLELDGATKLDEAGDEAIDDELNAALEGLFAKEELETVEAALETNEAGDIELEAITLDEAAGVADDTGAIVELEATELADTGTLLIKLETIELGVTELTLNILETELLLDESELNKLLKLEIGEDNTELDDEKGKLLLAELLDTGEDVVLDESKDELVKLEEFKLETLELFAAEALVITDELLLEDELLSGEALNTTFKGLLHGIVKSKLIAKKLYCTRQVRPLPDVRVWALAFGLKTVDNEAKHRVKITAEIVM